MFSSHPEKKQKHPRKFVCKADSSTCDAADAYLLLCRTRIAPVAINKEFLDTTVKQKLYTVNHYGFTDFYVKLSVKL